MVHYAFRLVWPWRSIVGLEIRIDRVGAKSKLGQNREQQDIEGAADGLRRRGHGALTDAMLTHAPKNEDR
jgi:transcriptional regulator